MANSLLAHVFWLAQVAMALAMTVPPTYADSPGQVAIPEELLGALRVEKFEGLPRTLLADRSALVHHLEAIIEKPPGNSAESARFIRRRAVIVLGLYGEARALPTLRKLAEDKNEEYRRDAIVGVGRTGTREGVAIAARFLKQEDESLREAAIDGLGASARKEALDVLKRFDASRDRPFIQRKRQEAIEKLNAAVGEGLIR